MQHAPCTMQIVYYLTQFMELDHSNGYGGKTNSSGDPAAAGYSAMVAAAGLSPLPLNMSVSLELEL